MMTSVQFLVLVWFPLCLLAGFEQVQLVRGVFFDESKVKLGEDDYGFEVDDLPPLVQQANRLLVAISAYNATDHPQRLLHLLQGLTEACENGLEIHVVLFTVVSWKGTVLDRPAITHCNRLLRDIPIAVSRHTPDVKFLLSALHRRVFADVLEKYDYFLYTEHDLALKWHNLKYLLEWEGLLQDSIYVPGLIRYEINRTRLDLHPRDRPLTDHFLAEPYFFPVLLVKKGNNTLIMPYNGYQAMWFLSRERLRPSVQKESWFTDYYKDYGKYAREYFAGGWYERNRTFRKVVPLSSLNAALVHHLSNNYAEHFDGLLERREKGGALSLEEATVLIERCTGNVGMTVQQLSVFNKTALDELKTGPIDGITTKPCSSCHAKGKHAWLLANFSHKYSKQITAEVVCVTTLQQNHFSNLYPNYH